MNKRDKDVLLMLSAREYTGQRALALACDCSLGAVNASVKNLLADGFIRSDMTVSDKGLELIKDSSPKRAILLAAGPGIKTAHDARGIPIPLMSVHNDVIIERLITQLQSAGVFEIYVVVGFSKESFEYLMDKFGVELIVNSEYSRKHTLHSLALAKDLLENAYIVPCNLLCNTNPFSKTELYSWYMVSDVKSPESPVRVNLKQELAVVSPNEDGNVMMGISYLTGKDAETVRERLIQMDGGGEHQWLSWEQALYTGDKMLPGANVVSSGDIVEVKSMEDLRDLERNNFINLSEIADIFDTHPSAITEVTLLKKGVVNCTYCFSFKGERYVVRIPREEFDLLTDRDHEGKVYEEVAALGLSEDVVYFDAKTGMKISKYIDDFRFCDPFSEDDVSACMKTLRELHSKKLMSGRSLDLFSTVEYIESLQKGMPSLYSDYEETKAAVFSLREYIDSCKVEMCLSHMDSVWENFMMLGDGSVKLIDWEYAAMCDPHADIAMFGVYALYNRQQMDRLIDAYFPEGCTKEVRLKIYCYISVCGLLWSNWCEYKYRNGTEFGEYSLRQYRYAKDYYKIVKEQLEM